MSKSIALSVLVALGPALLPMIGRGAPVDAPKASATRPVATQTATEAGERDPAGFPRPAGLVRKSYSMSPGAVRTEEVATYRARAELAEVAALYRDATKAAGWAEGAHSESGTGSNLVSIIDWTMPAKEAEVRFYAVKGGGTDLWVRVFTYKDKAGSKPVTAVVPPPASNNPVATKTGAANSKLTGAAPIGPPPTKISVVCDGDAASHLVSWQATAWASFDVFREDASGWVQIGDKVTDTSVHESALVPPNTKYKVVVRHTDGSEGSGEYIWADPPQPGTVEGVAATQTAAGEIHVTWKPLPYATRFRVFVSTVPSEGLLVSGRTAVLTDVPAGDCTVRVAPSYTIAGGEEIRLGNAWVNVSVYGDRYRIVLLGVECVHETADNPLQTDGKHDEIFAGAFVATVKPMAPDNAATSDDPRNRPPGSPHPNTSLDSSRPGPKHGPAGGGRGNPFARAEARLKAHSIPVPVDPGFVRTKVMGDTNGFPARLRAGTASELGGIQTGDFVPASTVTAPQPGVAATADRFPLLVWEGEVTAKSDYLAIAPVVFEWDADDGAWKSWCDWWTSTNGLDELGYHAKSPGSGLFATFSETVDSDSDDNGHKTKIWLAPGFGPDGTRPVGLGDEGGGSDIGFVLIPSGLLLNRTNLDAVLGGKSAVVIKQAFTDVTPSAFGVRLEGKYTLYIQIEHVVPPAAQAVVR